MTEVRPQAAATSIREYVQFDIVACNLEKVTLTGTLHIVFSTNFDSGGGVHFKETLSLHAQGTGSVTGAKYVVNEVKNTSSQLAAGSTETFTEEHSFLAIAQGSVPNTRVHATLHGTINANGEITAFVDNYRASCK